MTPSGRHLAFTPNATTPDNPSLNSLTYFKQCKGKENSPSKSRRNASLPEEIAELTKEAKEEEDLDKYRDMDLAPMEPVMESNNAGDLITFGTPAVSNIDLPPTSPTPSSRTSHQDTAIQASRRLMETSRSTVSTVVDERPDAVDATVAQTASKQPDVSPSHISLPDEKDDVAFVDADVVKSAESEWSVVHPEPPTFVTVISMLPKAIFWTAAAPVVKYSSKAYDALYEKFTKLEA